MEEILYEKLDKRKRDRNNSHETLGQIMVDAGNEFGPGTSYGESSFNISPINPLYYMTFWLLERRHLTTA